MERHFIIQDNFRINYLKFNNDKDLWDFIKHGGIVELLVQKNHSAIGVYIENPNNLTNYILREYLLTELTKEEYEHLYNITYV